MKQVAMRGSVSALSAFRILARPVAWLRRGALAMAVVLAVTAVPVLGAATASAAEGGAGVSGTVALGGGLGGQIDERTGALHASLPVVSLPGRGGAAVSLALVYDQQAAGRGLDRFGFGAGMGLSVPYVDPSDSGTLYTAGSGTFGIASGDAGGTGLKRYPQKDAAFRTQPGVLPEREGLGEAERSYRYVLAFSDGRRQYFSADGDLIAETGRFGHETAYVWERYAEQRRLSRVVDAYGQSAEFAWGQDQQGREEITVTSPERSDRTRPQTKLGLEGGRLVSVTDPEGQRTALQYDYAPPALPGRLLTRVEAPAGAVARMEYAEPHGFPVTSSVKVTDPDSRQLTAERTFTLAPDGEHAGHDFTGRGRYASADELFDSADPGYRYTTELADQNSAVRSTYNSLHLLKERTAHIKLGGELRPVRSQKLEYAGESEGGAVPPAASALPPNYARPVRAAVTFHDPGSGKSRTTAETTRFDDHGREVERTDAAGATTVTEYDAPALDSGGPGSPSGGYGLVLRQTVTGPDGAQAVTENTLSQDRRSITSTRQSVKNSGNQQPSARTVTSFSVNEHGEVTQKSVTWASEEAKPDGVEVPQEITETYETAVDTAAHTRTDTVKNTAGTSSQTADLVTGQVVRATDAGGRTVETKYDGIARPVEERAPDGLVTTTAYTPVTTTVTAPGHGGGTHITVEERDLLGRVSKKTDNVRDGAYTGDPRARTLQSVTFEDGGRTAKVTDALGRTTVTVHDDLGRPVRTVEPSGVTRLAVYADAATGSTATVTTLTLPAGETDPAKAVSSRTETLDHAGRPVATDSAFTDGTQQTGTRQAYDSLGRVAQSVSQDVASVPVYGAAGQADATTLTPQSEAFPGQAVTASTPRDLAGVPVVKTLTPGSGEGRAGAARIRDAAGRITEERRQDGKKTSFTYTADGQVKESVSPAGTRTAYTYQDTTGRLLETAVTSADGTATERTAYTYDPHSGAVTAVYSPDDEAATKISYTYDADGNVTSVTYPGGKSIRRTFGPHGQLRTVTDTAGLTTAYTHNSDGTLARAVQHGQDSQQAAAEVSFTYDSLGRTTRIDRGNGVVTEVEYTSASQVRHEKTTRDGQTLTEAAYTYDSHGNVTERTDDRPPVTAEGTPGPREKTTTRYTYDAYNRLTQSQVTGADGAVLATTAYTLNVSGDVTRTETTPGTGPDAGAPALARHDIDTAGRLTAVTAGGKTQDQAFDDEGNLLTDAQGRQYTYNLKNQPLSVTAPDGKTTRYTYWADGTRSASEETAGGSTALTRFYYSPDGSLLNDTHSTTSGGTDTAGTTASYLMAGTRQARTLTGPGADKAAPTGSGYLLTDRHGSTTALTRTDTGEISAAWHYSDYGQHLTSTGQPAPAGPSGPARNPFTYAGEYTNQETGTQYLKSRIYDPSQARFITRDATALHNRYQYADANPVMKTDPTGESAEWDVNTLRGATMAGFSILSAIAGIVITALTPATLPVMIATMVITLLDLSATTMGLVNFADAMHTTPFLTRQQRDIIAWTGLTAGTVAAVASIGKGILAIPKAGAYKAINEGENYATWALRQSARPTEEALAKSTASVWRKISGGAKEEKVDAGTVLARAPQDVHGLIKDQAGAAAHLHAAARQSTNAAVKENLKAASQERINFLNRTFFKKSERTPPTETAANTLITE
ncbi:RHS repeat-associated core domain-containing protein [Streptomyces sp. NPDC008121]|uniref:RHS repeat domain-containing protein n=1 Tax=Streptomyces sp. NPDC008121 TaxID=3364809 RepID=UPI0036EEB98E